MAALCACQSRVRLLSYNVENLFDDRTTGREYPEFRGERWNRGLYPLKLAALGRVIRRCCRGGPEVVVLQEVESEAALLALRDRHLGSLGYRQAIFAGGGGAGQEEQTAALTGVAVLTRLPVLRTRVYQPGSFADAALRPILEVELAVRGRSLTVFNCHWKSKIGGVEATAPARLLSAEVLARRLSAVLAADPLAEWLLAGDFNLNLEELTVPGQPIRAALRPDEAGLVAGGLRLYDPWRELPPEQRGSAVYRGRWQTPDHFLLAPGLLDDEQLSYHPGSFRVVRLPFLLEPSSGLPRRFDPTRAAGVSDHLPLLLEIVLSRRE